MNKIIPKGYKQTKVGLIPKDWKVVRSDTVLQRVRKKVNVQKDEKYQQIGIRSHAKGLFHKELVTGEILGNKSVFWIEEDCFIVNIVFAWEQAVAKTTHKEKGMIASHRFPMYQPKDNGVDIDYLLYFFKSKRGKHLLGLASPGGAGRNKTLGQGEFNELKLPLPPLQEQEKIAKILSTWDNAIVKQEQLIEQKKLLKKGLMQRLFSEKWKVVKIGDILTIGSGKDYKHLKHGDIPVYGTGGYMLSVNEYLHDGESVCIGRKGTIDKPIFLEGKFWTVDTLFYTHSYKDTIPKFLYFYFLQINWKRYNEASGVPSLSKKTIETIKIKLPSLLEQQKIAKILSLAEREIDLLKNELSELKNQKKALMQKLLTGEVRVVI